MIAPSDRVWLPSHRLIVRSCGVTAAKEGIMRLHRHHKRLAGAKAAFEVVNAARWPVGWATVGRPVSPALQAQGWLEVTRVATDGTPNACSKLYAAARRAFRGKCAQLCTYTLITESGALLRGAGWRPDHITRGGQWHRDGRPRPPSQGGGVPKVRWVAW